MTIPALATLIALAFPPSTIQAQPAPKAAPVPSLEDVIARALQTHPEILVAEAKLAGAKADLELAKLALSQKIAKAKNRYDTAKQTEIHAERALSFIEPLVRSKAIEEQEMGRTREKLDLAKALRIEAEAEWKAFQPPAKQPMTIDSIYSKVAARPLAEPTQAERDRYELLMRPLKLKKADKLNLVEATKLLQSQPELKGLTLRVPMWMSRTMVKAPPVISWDEREMTVAGWLQFFADEFNPQARAEGGNATDFKPGQYEWYLREYGLVLVEDKPVSTLSLAEFLKTIRNSPPAPKG